MTNKEFQIEKAKSLISIGGSCFSGGIVGLIGTISINAANGKLAANNILNTNNSISLGFAFFAFGLFLLLGIYLHSRGLKILKGCTNRLKPSKK